MTIIEDSQVDGWLRSIGVVRLCEWDALIFLARHCTSLCSVGQIALLLGYTREAVGKALDSLVGLKLVTRSRSSQGVRLYRASVSAPVPELQELLKLSEDRNGRLLIAKRLHEQNKQMNFANGAGLHVA